jgi:hypothetical protein
MPSPWPISGSPSSRRDFLGQAGGGMGLWALGSLLQADQARAATTLANPLRPHASHPAPGA